MILRHIITLNGQPITKLIDDAHIDAEFANIKGQIMAQGGDPKVLGIKTDIELEAGEYECEW